MNKDIFIVFKVASRGRKIEAKEMNMEIMHQVTNMSYMIL